MLEPSGRINCQGTATSFPLPELLEPSEPLVPEAPVELVELLEDWLLVDDGLLELRPPLDEDDPLDPTEMTAKSTRPEVGLIITSLIVPRLDSPAVDPLIWAPINLLAWISCWPPRPVALNELDDLLPEMPEDESLDDPLDRPLLDDELCFELLVPDEVSDEFCA